MKAQLTVEYLLCFLAFVAFASVFIGFFGDALREAKELRVNATVARKNNDACVLSAFFSANSERAVYFTNAFENASIEECGLNARRVGFLEVEGTE
ncbi:MAG: hypothetical protein V1834_00075 [Candidatus Micrarchaeota archaeon]